MGSSRCVDKNWSFLCLVVTCLINQALLSDAAAPRRGDLEFPEPSSYDHKDPGRLSQRHYMQKQHDQPQGCDNGTIGEPSSCSHDLLTTLYGDPVYPNPLFSKRKMWFARRLNVGVYVAGQLTARHIKYAADSGMKSIVTIFDQTGKKGANGETLILSTDEEEELTKLAGMKFFRVLGPNDYEDWFTVRAVDRMDAVYPKVELPALFHCERAVSVAMIILLHYVRESQKPPNLADPKIPFMDSRRFYQLNYLHGLDFVDVFAPWTNDTIKNVTGQDMPADVSRLDVAIPMWFDYWQARPIRGSWFMAGQIHAVELPTINATGFLTVLNLRPGLLYKGKPSQENVELVNIKSKTPTYDVNGNSLRQTEANLQTLIIDSSRPAKYVNQSSERNYESENAEEFGDHVGYNEQMEREAVRRAGIDYAHLPLRKSPCGC